MTMRIRFLLPLFTADWDGFLREIWDFREGLLSTWVMTSMTLDKELGIETLNNAIEKISTYIRSKG